jgi:hypothetical protein
MIKINPGRVLRHIFIVGLLSQVMDNAIGNVVNVVKAKDSEILAGGKTQPVSNQVMEVNVMNKVNPGQVLQNQVVDDVNMNVVNKDNPGQILQNQVEDNGNVNKREQVLLNVEDVNAVDAVDAETKEKAVNAVIAEAEENMVNEDNPEQDLPSQVGEKNIVDEEQEDEDVIDPDSDADAEHDEDQGDVDELGSMIDSDFDLTWSWLGLASNKTRMMTPMWTLSMMISLGMWKCSTPTPTWSWSGLALTLTPMVTPSTMRMRLSY